MWTLFIDPNKRNDYEAFLSHDHCVRIYLNCLIYSFTDYGHLLSVEYWIGQYLSFVFT